MYYCTIIVLMLSHINCLFELPSVEGKIAMNCVIPVFYFSLAFPALIYLRPGNLLDRSLTSSQITITEEDDDVTVN